jgi:hypothetical protein
VTDEIQRAVGLLCFTRRLETSTDAFSLLGAETQKIAHAKNVLFNTGCFPLLSGRTSSVHKVPTYPKHSLYFVPIVPARLALPAVCV